MSNDDLHLAAINARKVFYANPDPDALDFLAFIYNNGHCSICRHSTVEAIETIAPVPEWMLQEGLYDANSALRTWAEERLKD